MVPDPEAYDPKRGEGKYTAESLALSDKLNETQAKTGEDVANVKCTSCHKMSDEKLVGPGWAGVTKRRTGEWIMNFITNPDPMLDKDPEAQAMLELCLVRMPNQSLTDDDARAILEYMRKNDGLK
jgi:mono/diheme cytochrome c family protein